MAPTQHPSQSRIIRPPPKDSLGQNLPTPTCPPPSLHKLVTDRSQEGSHKEGPGLHGTFVPAGMCLMRCASGPWVSGVVPKVKLELGGARQREGLLPCYLIGEVRDFQTAYSGSRSPEGGRCRLQQKTHQARNQDICVLAWFLPLTCCVTLGGLLPLSRPQFFCGSFLP